ncbi:MAG: hypothetical protein ACXVVK_19695 [Solirubrobacteraceae bacterium]
MPVLLIHGNPDTAAVWNRVRTHLTAYDEEVVAAAERHPLLEYRLRLLPADAPAAAAGRRPTSRSARSARTGRRWR